jgi:two-component system cell cycle response regulator DivK
VGDGTEFTLTLPLLGHSGRKQETDPESIPDLGLDGARVLVAEDNGVNRVLMTDLLRLAGCEVLEAVDGEQALAVARSETPDLVVLDIMLPVMDGISVARLLKKDPNTRGIRIIAVTALAMSDDRERIMNAGCDAYLAKPFTHDQYLKAVTDVLTSRAPV